MFNYYQILAILAFLFVGLERFWPRVPGQAVFRKSWLSDAVYLVFNSKYAGVLLGYFTVLWIIRVDAMLPKGWLVKWPFLAQFLMLLVSMDFIKWCTHNMLHRVQFLWEFHKVHHSIVEMDWMGDWRFHWVEIVVYNGRVADLGVS